MFGFENQAVNHLDQLCINYCNERLHKFYVDACFVAEKTLYADEGLPFATVIPTYSDALPLIERPPTNIFSVIATASNTPGASVSWMMQVEEKEKKKKRKTDRQSEEEDGGGGLYSLSKDMTGLCTLLPCLHV